MRHYVVLSLVALMFALAASAQDSSAPNQSQVPSSMSSPAASPTVPEKPAVENEADPLMDLPPLPKGEVSLVGGTVTGIDRVRNRLTLEAFGGKKMKFTFDERTHIYRDGVETTQLGIRKGDRVYVDTQLLGTTAFARNIRVQGKANSAYVEGQIESYDASRGTLVLKDRLSSEAATFRISPSTVVKGKITSLSELRQGALVNVRFVPGKGDGVAQEITVTARPGETFTFAGNVTFLDVRTGTLAVHNLTDNKTYEIHYDPARGGFDNLGLGSDINVIAEFDGSNYTARQLTVMQASNPK